MSSVLLLPGLAAAQGGGATISGQVVSEAGAPIASASVFIEGTNIGTLTGADGKYSIIVAPANVNGQKATLTARLIGYRTRSVSITLSPGTITQSFTLVSNPVQLQGVVVTALGVEKPKSELGTAQQELSSSELNSTHSQNFEDQLAGKVSGLQLTGSGTQGGSVNMIIRGQNSITGSNEPLFIVDGVAVSNNDRGGDANGGGAMSGGWDFGSAISDINPNDIATISVLKGPNAAALYGSRAANGVIVITTKHGQNTNGKINTHLTANYSFDHVGRLPDYQNLYGQGSAGQFQYVDGNGGGIQDYNDQSYGPRFNGQPIDQFTGKAQPWIAHPNNVASFFNLGHTIDGNLSVSGGSDRANSRLSVGTQNVDGIVPNSYFHKFNSALTGQLKLGSKITTNGTLEYISTNNDNRPGVGYNTGIMEQFIWFGRQVDMNALRANYNKFDQFGRHYNWNTSYHSNPFWLQYDNPERDGRERFIGTVSADYKMTNWLTAHVQTGSDIYNQDINQNFAQDNVSWSAVGIDNPNFAGGFSLFHAYSNDNNTSAQLVANKQVSPKLAVSGLLGANRRFATYQSRTQSTAGIIVPNVYTVTNAAIPPTLNQFTQRVGINSVYADASFTWDGWWTVEGTARNDWSSTLPRKNNSYFYPSINTSIVLSDAIPSIKSHFLSYVKVRGSIAKVGSDAPPYSLDPVTYGGFSNPFGSAALYTANNLIGDPNLKPEITKSGEVGLELGFFGQRASLDATYYNKNTTNEIINPPIAPSSGFQQAEVNAGKISNKGFEALLNVTPIRTRSGFEWNTTLSYSRNRSRVDAITPQINDIVLGGSWGLQERAQVGQPYGEFYGYTIARDSATGQIITSGGLPAFGNYTALGSVEPDWLGGWNNEFKFKHLSLSFLLDVHRGGHIFSVSNMFGDYTGVFARTIVGRQVDWNNPGIVVKGLDVSGSPNIDTVTSEQYFQNFFELHQQYVYNDSYMKLRELRLGYTLPNSLTSALHAQAVDVAVYGRNLWTSTNVPNIDPEFAYSTGNFQGVEFAALPNPRSFGINLQVTP